MLPHIRSSDESGLSLGKTGVLMRVDLQDQDNIATAVHGSPSRRGLTESCSNVSNL